MASESHPQTCQRSLVTWAGGPLMIVYQIQSDGRVLVIDGAHRRHVSEDRIPMKWVAFHLLQHIYGPRTARELCETFWPALKRMFARPGRYVTSEEVALWAARERERRMTAEGGGPTKQEEVAV